MSFRTSLSLSAAFESLKTQAAASKAYLTSQKALMQQATCDAAVPLQVIQHLAQADALMSAWAALDGLAAYAKAQYNDPAYDVVAEFTAMKNAFANARTQLMAMFPKDASGYLLYQTLAANGAAVNRTFTSAELAPVVTLLNAIIATIG